MVSRKRTIIGQILVAKCMQYSRIKGLRLSRITLGTAQLGMNYGIANVTGQPSISTAFDILSLAIDYGIVCFDTAPSYKDSESILGSFFLEERNISGSPVIFTKLPSITHTKQTNYLKIEKLAFHYITTSLRKLNLDKIPIYLLHDPGNLTSHKGDILKALLTAKESGLIEHLGVSVYDYDEIISCLEIPEIDVLQAPINIFDHRLINTNLLTRFRREEIILLARSIFLQGLVFLQPNNLPSSVKNSARFLFKLREISEREEISVKQLCFNFIRDLPGITSMIIGVETSGQLKENIELLLTPSLSSDLKKEIQEEFGDLPREVIDPRKWKR